MASIPARPRVAIACGGTGGHLFPGVAVGECLRDRGCRMTLLVSPKEVDQQAVKQIQGMEVLTLPAVALTRGAFLAFVSGFLKSYRAATAAFRQAPPDAALAMGGFTSAPPILAAKRLGALAFLHESNTIPGRANRWLSWMVVRSFVGFPSAAARLRSSAVSLTGTPVRREFQASDPRECRAALGLDPGRPVLLITGGSQGASGVNRLVKGAVPHIAKVAPELQWFHITGARDLDEVKHAYAAQNLDAAVHPFFGSMALALGAATVVVSRAGASSLAEIAAMRTPPVLIPYPVAMDNHQFHNARAFEESGAARLLNERSASPEVLARTVIQLLGDATAQANMRKALAKWHAPDAAARMADFILQAVTSRPVGSRDRTRAVSGSEDVQRRVFVRV